MFDEETEQRIGFLAEANKISQSAAEKLHVEQTKINLFAGLEERAKARKRDNRMRKHGNRVDGKMRGAGND